MDRGRVLEASIRISIFGGCWTRRLSRRVRGVRGWACRLGPTARGRGSEGGEEEGAVVGFGLLSMRNRLVASVWNACGSPYCRCREGSVEEEILTEFLERRSGRGDWEEEAASSLSESPDELW